MTQASLFDEVAAIALPPDISISRHRGNHASIDANPSSEHKAIMRDKVLDVIRRKGVTHSKEIAKILGVEIHKVSGRLSELLVLKKITRLKERVDGCSLLTIK